jgi:hypothetical protein
MLAVFRLDGIGRAEMADTHPAQALDVIKRVEMMCDFLKNPIITQAIENGVPVTMPRLPGALGFDIPLWVGLGMVGIWASLDAFAERAGLPGAICETCQGRTCIRARFDNRLQDDEERSSFAEIEDIRHLYAHNFAGHADEQYFWRPRHVLASGTQTKLASGAEFDGKRLQLDLSDLRFYSSFAQKVLSRFS